MTNNDHAKHILIADDEVPFRFAAVLALRRAGYRTSEAQDGADALVKILGNGTHIPFDLIILDIHMPYLSGLKVCDILRERGVYVPVLFVAAFVDESEIERIVPDNAYSLLKKPFRIEQMISKVQEMVCQ
ncbi:MAG: response regulator [Nitrospirae bacterium]|nr:response regulator [Nitrospirota bacterium]